LHAAADVENNPNAEGNIFCREILDLLFDFVFPHLELLLLEAADVPVRVIRYACVEQHQVYIYSESGPGGALERVMQFCNVLVLSQGHHSA
jgi:hypothetical protein